MLIVLHRCGVVFLVGLLPSGVAGALALLPAGVQPGDLLAIDARNRASCLAASVPGARCLPVADFHADPFGLASFRDVAWALGTAGLDGSRPVLVFADDPRDRDTVAALLHLAGQRAVWRWPGDAAELLARLGSQPGRGRSIVRTRLYTATMRDDLIVLPSELDALRLAGWSLHVAGGPGEAVESPTVVTADDVTVALAAFAALLGGDPRESGPVRVRIMLDRPSPATGTDVRPSRWLGIGLLGIALLLAVVAWRYRREAS